MMRRSARRGACIGITTVVMLFTVLTLTILSVLSLETANQEWQLANSSAASVTAYYAADSRAAAVCDAVRATAPGLLSDGAVLENVRLTVSEDENLVSYAVPIDGRQSLRVCLERTEDGWSIAAWQAAQTGEWSADGDLHVWSGPEQ